MRWMYWDDLRALINAHKLPWREIKYYRSSNGFKDTISICDFQLPRRKGTISTADGHESDWYRDSFVCNAGWMGGSIPLEDSPYIYNEIDDKWERWPVRGARGTVQILAKQGVIASSPEVLEFMRTGYLRRS